MKKISLFKTYECMDEVPYHYVRANQLGILVFVILTILTQFYGLLIIPFAVQIISRTFGIQYNLFVRFIAPILPASQKTESRELLRFNNLLAIIFLTGSLISFFMGANIIGYIFLSMLSIAILLALSGFCLGCFIYFQWKQFKSRRKQISK
jgi:hypothetical protein